MTSHRPAAASAPTDRRVRASESFVINAGFLLSWDADLDAHAKNFAELLQALGFVPVATVAKRRRQFWIDYAGRTVEGAYDVVSGIGTFIELELKADDSNLEETKRAIGELARKLDLGPSIRSSYLEMLLAKNA